MLQKSLRPTVLHVYTCTCDLKWNVSQSNQCFKNDSNRSLDKEKHQRKTVFKIGKHNEHETCRQKYIRQY